MAYITFSCIECGQRVTKRRSPTHRPPRFCSQRCNGAFKTRNRQGPTPNYIFECEQCGKRTATYRSPSARAPRFCSLDCLGASQRGEGNPSFSGGRYIDPNGYVHVLLPEHPLADCRGYVYEHRVIAEKSIGRRLLQTEVVHHRNGVKSDNSPSNLQVLANQGAHSQLHMKMRAKQ